MQTNSDTYQIRVDNRKLVEPVKRLHVVETDHFVHSFTASHEMEICKLMQMSGGLKYLNTIDLHPSEKRNIKMEALIQMEIEYNWNKIKSMLL